MIIGKGMIANAFSEFSKDTSVLIFASGVSDSKQSDPAVFMREELLVKENLQKHPEVLFVYFSTYSVLDPFQVSSPYAQHKIHMEELIVHSGVPFLIIRASNVVGENGNPSTVFNFFRDRILSGDAFDVWMHSCRNFIDIEDLVKLTSALIKKSIRNSIYTIANPIPVSVPDFVAKMEAHLGKTANKNLIEKGSWFHPDTNFVSVIARNAGVEFDPSYIDRLIQKYSR